MSLSIDLSKKAEAEKSIGDFLDLYIMSGLTKDALEMIESLHATHFGEPKAGILYAETDTGKSATIETYKRAYMKSHRNASADVDELPILHIKLKDACTRDWLYTSILKKLGDPKPTAGQLSEKETRIAALARARKLTLLVIDDFNRILRRRGGAYNETVAHAIQKLLDEELRVPILMVGITRCRAVLDDLPELERRTPFKRQLSPFKCKNEVDVFRFKAFLKVLEEHVPGGTMPLDSELMAMRLFYVSNGVVGRIKTLIAMAIRKKSKPDEPLQLADFSVAFKSIYEHNETEKHRAQSPRGNPSRKSSSRTLVGDDEQLYVPRVNPFLKKYSSAWFVNELNWWVARDEL